MRRGLRFLGGAIGVLTLGLWLVTGADKGWTKTSVVIMKTDPVTELRYPDSEKRFIAGVDFLAVGLGLAALLGGSSMIGRRKNQPNQT